MMMDFNKLYKEFNCTYKYTNGDLLNEPNNYSYAEVDGISFIKEYFNIRKDAVEYLKNNMINDNEDMIYEKLINQLGNTKDKISNRQENTQQELISILYCIENNIEYFYIKYKTIFSNYVRKYEVSKRIYSQYDSNFEKKTSNYYLLINYALLSLCCIKYYEKTGKIKYLNTAIKLNDLLCSVKNSLQGIEVYLTYKSICNEINLINLLYSQEGIKL